MIIVDKMVEILDENSTFRRIFEEELKFLHKYSPDNWGITFHAKDKIRIQYKWLIVMTIGKSRIWLSTAPQDYYSLNNLNCWEWDKNDYPKYTRFNINSINGYFSGTYNEWKKVKASHTKYIESMEKQQYHLSESTRKNFESDFVDTVQKKFNISLPFPDYYIDIDKETQKILPELSEDEVANISITTKKQLVKARIGQDKFRKKLISKYGKCQICSIDIETALRASHIKPWSKSNNKERLDPKNGLLLCANHDVLFDKHLISFSDNGEILISKHIPSEAMKNLNLKEGTKLKLSKKTMDYMAEHRNAYYKKQHK